MSYEVVVTREGEKWLADVPSIPGVHTWADSFDELQKAVEEAVEVTLDSPVDPEDLVFDLVSPYANAQTDWEAVARWLADGSNSRPMHANAEELLAYAVSHVTRGN